MEEVPGWQSTTEAIELDTFPRLLLHHAKVRADASGDAREGSRHLADLDLGGRSPTRCARSPAAWPRRASGAAMHLAIIGDNRPRLYWSMCAAQALGGVPVPMYQDAPAAEFVFVLNDAEIAFAHRRGPGAGRQAARGAAAGAHAHAHLLRRSARPAQLRRASRATSGCRRSAASTIARIRASSTARSRRASPATSSIMLYTSGTTGQAEGRVPDARGVHRRRRAAASNSTS